MKQQNWQRVIFNFCVVLNCLLVFLLIFGNRFVVPQFLQAFGRAHPLVLHFPIVLLLLAFLFEMLIVSPKQAMLKGIADWLLLAAVLTTVIAALMGLFLSKEEGYEGDALNVHKWTGVACAFISFIWYGLKELIRKKKIVTVAMGMTATIVLLIAGHKGANLTHGEDFLLSPIFAANEQPVVPLEDAVIYSHLVQPIIEKKCMSCHNTSKAKGELIMETRELLLKGGKSGILWDTTAVDFGLMMQRIHLPVEDEKHMPPKGKPQLTEEESRVLQLWIKDGASFTKKITELPANDSLRLLAASFFKSSDVEVYDFAAIDESTISQLNTEYRVITPLATASPALSVNFYGVAQFKSDQLKDLSKIKDNIVSLHLAKMPVKDEDLQVIGTFNNLRDLNLAFTAIKGDGLKHLTGLKNLKQISLSGTGITVSQLQPLKQLKKLRSIKVWNTAVATKDLASLKTGFPNTNFDFGYKGDTVIAKLPAPFITADKDKRIFKSTSIITIKTPISGAITRYTLDGSQPDSLNSPIYKKPFSINKSVTVNARSFLKGWINSDKVSTGFYKNSFKPDSVYLNTPPESRYVATAKKGQAFFDEILGGTFFKDLEWVGFKTDIFETFLFFKQPKNISSVTFNTLIDAKRFILPPSEIEVWGGEDVGSLKLLSKVTTSQLVLTQPAPAFIKTYDAAFQTNTVKVIKLIAKPAKKPAILRAAPPKPQKQKQANANVKAKAQKQKQVKPKAAVKKPAKAFEALMFFDEIFLN